MSEEINAWICEFDGCNLLFENPIALPCGKAICKEHIENYTEQFECIFCGREHKIPEDGFNVNITIMKMINCCYHLNNIHKEAKMSYDLLNSMIDEYDKIDPDEFIYDYFAHVRNKVDLHREHIINDVNEKSDKIIDTLRIQEKECREKAGSIEKISLKELKNQLASAWKHNLRQPTIDESSLNILLTQMNHHIKFMEFEIRKYKKDLLLEKSFDFEKIDDNPILFGKLIEKTIDLSLSDDCGSLIRDFNQHSGSVRSIQFIENSNRLISASQDNTIKVWDLKTGECLKTLNEHERWVTCILTISNNQLVSSSNDKTIKIWDLEKYECVNSLISDSSVYSLCQLQDNKLATGRMDGLIDIWDMNSLTIQETILAHDDWITSLKLIDNQRFISCSGDSLMKIWNIESFGCIRTLAGHSNIIYGFDFTHDGLLLSGSSDKSIKIWNIESGECLKTISLENSIICFKKVSNDLLVVGTNNQNGENLIIYDYAKNKILRKYSAHSKYINQIELLKNGNLLTASGDCSIKLWEFLKL